MNVMLGRLFTACDDLFSHLCADQVVDHELWDTERKAFRDALDAYRTHYVPDISDPVVDPAFVVNTMGLDATSALWHNVFRVISAVNLTSLLDEISPLRRQDLTQDNLQDVLPLLQDWDAMFPKIFVLGDPNTTDSRTNEQIIEQALMIRTQLTISTLQRLQRDSPTPFHPLEQVARIWCESPVSAEAVEAFLGSNEAALQLKSIMAADPQVITDRHAARFTSICNMLPHKPVAGLDLDLRPVLEQFPFRSFVENLCSFVRGHFTAIKELLQQGPSLGRDLSLSVVPPATGPRTDSGIRPQLETDALARTLDRTEHGHGYVTPSVIFPSQIADHVFFIPSASALSYNMDSLRRMKQLEQHAPGVYNHGDQLPPSSYPPAPRIPYPPGFSSPTGGLVYAESAHQSGFQSNGTMYAESAAQVSGGKRRAPDEPSADGTSGGTVPVAKRPRERRKKTDVPNPSVAPSTHATASTQSTAPVVQSQYPPLPGTQDEPDYDALRQRTREISAAKRKAREPQVRSAWVRNDVRLLVKAVDTYSCKWSLIEKEIKRGTIPFERPRDQQALRDKARLLKQDFLK